MNSSPAGLAGLYDAICDELGCEMSRDRTDDGRSAHGHVNGRATSRFATIRVVDRTELRCDVPQVQQRYADRASPRPNCSSPHWRRNQTLRRLAPTSLSRERGT
jgi:hypothetical protein